MSATTFFFVLVGAGTLTLQFFRILDAIERPSRRSGAETR